MSYMSLGIRHDDMSSLPTAPSPSPARWGSQKLAVRKRGLTYGGSLLPKKTMPTTLTTKTVQPRPAWGPGTMTSVPKPKTPTLTTDTTRPPPEEEILDRAEDERVVKDAPVAMPYPAPRGGSAPFLPPKKTGPVLTTMPVDPSPFPAPPRGGGLPMPLLIGGAAAIALLLLRR